MSLVISVVRRSFAGLAAGLLLSLPAWGQGGSGVGGCGDRPLEAAAASGSVDEFLALFDERVDRRRKQLEEALTNRLFGMTVSSPKSSQLPTRDELRKFYANRGGCLDVLLDHAVAAGNIPVIDALLAAGADVNGRPDHGSEFFVKDGVVQQRLPSVYEQSLLMRCKRVAGPREEVISGSYPRASDEQRARTRRGFEHILARGADVNLLDRDGRGALERCENADVLPLLVAHGADPNRPAGKQSHLSLWVWRLIEADRLGTEVLAVYRAEVIAALDGLLPALRSKMLSPSEELSVCTVCGGGKATACAALKQRIQVTDERMLQADASLDAAETAQPRVERCLAYQRQDHSRPYSWDPVANARACTFAPRYLPSDVVAVAAGGRGGRTLDFQIDDSGFVATQFDVKVHADQPVALLLAGYEPTVWALSWTAGTRIAAVHVSGNERQVVTGLPPGTPLIVSTERAPAGCANRFSAERQLRWEVRDTAQAREIFGQDVARVVRSQGRDGVLDINLSTRPVGPYERSPGPAPDSYRDPRMPVAGAAGLQWAVGQGLLRRATDAERKQAQGRTGWAPKPDHTYVVLKPMVLPAGLTGNDFALPAGVADGFSIVSPVHLFIVPPGVPVPVGRARGTTVIDLNQPVP